MSKTLKCYWVSPCHRFQCQNVNCSESTSSQIVCWKEKTEVSFLCEEHTKDMSAGLVAKGYALINPSGKEDQSNHPSYVLVKQKKKSAAKTKCSVNDCKNSGTHLWQDQKNSEDTFLLCGSCTRNFFPVAPSNSETSKSKPSPPIKDKPSNRMPMLELTPTEREEHLKRLFTVKKGRKKDSYWTDIMLVAGPDETWPFTKSSQAICAYCEKCDTFFPYNHKTNSKSNVTHKTSCPVILQTKNTTPKKKATPLLPTQSNKTRKLEEELQASQAEIEKLRAAADAESARLKILSEQKAAAEQKALLAAQEAERLKAMSEGTKTLLETLSSRINEQEKEQEKLSKKQIDMGDEMMKKLNEGIGRIENLITAGAKDKKKHKKKRKRRDSDSDSSDSSSDDGRKAKKPPHWYAPPPFAYPSFPPPYGPPQPPPPPPHGHLGNQQNRFY